MDTAMGMGILRMLPEPGAGRRVQIKRWGCCDSGFLLVLDRLNPARKLSPVPALGVQYQGIRLLGLRRVSMRAAAFRKFAQDLG